MNIKFLTEFTQEDLAKLVILPNERFINYATAGRSTIIQPATDKLPKLWYSIVDYSTDPVTTILYTTQKEFDTWQTLVGGQGGGGITIKVDDHLDINSTNPVQNKVITEELNKINDILNPLKLIVSGGGLFEKGTTQLITITWNLKKGESTVQPEESKVNGQVASGNSQQFTGVKDDTTYNVECTFEGKSVQGSTKVSFIAPMYFGFDAADSIDGLTIEGLNKQSIKSSPAGDYTLNNPTNGNYLWLCIPNSMNISKVTSGGFEVPMEAAQNKGTSIDNYKCYRSSSSINQGNMTITIA